MMQYETKWTHWKHHTEGYGVACNGFSSAESVDILTGGSNLPCCTDRTPAGCDRTGAAVLSGDIWKETLYCEWYIVSDIILSVIYCDIILWYIVSDIILSVIYCDIILCYHIVIYCKWYHIVNDIILSVIYCDIILWYIVSDIISSVIYCDIILWYIESHIILSVTYCDIILWYIVSHIILSLLSFCPWYIVSDIL